MRNKQLCTIVVGVIVLGAFSAGAQEKAPGAAGAAASGATAAQAPPPPAPGALPLPPAAAPAAPTESLPAAAKGDVIVFKSKRRLENVQVIRETAQRVFVKTFTGMEPVSIPRDQIETIEYDDVGDSASAAKPAASEGEGAIAGTQVSADLSRKLTQTLPGGVVSKDDIPFSEAVEQLAKKIEITIEVTDAAKKMLGEVRAKEITIEDKSTILSFLRDTLKHRFPELDVRLMFDKVQLAKKGEAEAKPAAPAPVAAPVAAPAAAAPAAVPAVSVAPPAAPAAPAAGSEKAPAAPKNP